MKGVLMKDEGNKQAGRRAGYCGVENDDNADDG